MANIKSAKKRIRQNAKRQTRNRWWKSRVRTATKNVLTAVEGEKKAEAQDALKLAMKEISKAAQKGIFHKSAASRKVSRLSRLVASLS